jgi:hypothetical protein
MSPVVENGIAGSETKVNLKMLGKPLQHANNRMSLSQTMPFFTTG